nr:MAG TPA: Protein of unknown function (DUF674) [Caudoviricetes sp.]
MDFLSSFLYLPLGIKKKDNNLTFEVFCVSFAYP